MFDGKTYNPELDEERLKAQLQRVLSCMLDRQWRTLEQISVTTGDNVSSISARLRDLRKTDHGSWKVDRRRVPGRKGLHEYRVRPVTDLGSEIGCTTRLKRPPLEALRQTLEGMRAAYHAVPKQHQPGLVDTMRWIAAIVEGKKQ